MLPTGDRLLLAVHHGPRSTRALAGLLRVDVATVHRMLAHYEREGVLARERGPRDPADRWRVAEGVRVEYRPGRVLLHRAGGTRGGEDAAAPAAGETPAAPAAAPAAAVPVAPGTLASPEGPTSEPAPVPALERPRCAAVTSRGGRCTRLPRSGPWCATHAPTP